MRRSVPYQGDVAAVRKRPGRPRVTKPVDVVVSLRLPRDAVEQARKAAEAEDRPLAYVLRRLVIEGLRRG